MSTKDSATHTTESAEKPETSNDEVKAAFAEHAQKVDHALEAAGKVAEILAQFAPVKTYVWREIERDTVDEDGNELPPLRVRLVDLTVAQTESIPWGTRVALRDSYQAIAPFVVEWDLEAEKLTTGEVVPVPPPAEFGWEILELLTNTEGSSLINWLKVPHYMKAEAEKKSQTRSSTTTRRPKRKG